MSKELSDKEKRRIIIEDLKQVLKDSKEFWTDMNTNKPQITLKNAIKYLKNLKC